MKRFTLDKKVYEQVIKATPGSSPFGIENLPTKIDYIQLYIMDMEDNLLLKDYLSQDEIKTLLVNSFKSSFLKDTEKKKWISKI